MKTLIRSKVLKGLGLIAIVTGLTAAVAQEELTPAQQAEKCEAEGGCALFTRNALMEMLRSVFQNGYTRGVMSCTKSI
jgi:hypothetical protein